MKVYGELVSAQAECLASAPSVTPKGRVYFDTTSGVVKVYDGSAWRVLVSRDGTETLSGKTLTAPTLTDGSDTTKKIVFGISGVTTATTRTLTVPDADTIIVGTGTTQSLTNKTLDNTNTVTLKDTLFTLQDDADVTKQARFQLSSIATGTTRTYTLPAGGGTVVTTDGVQTLTDKTLDNTSVLNVTDANFTLEDNSVGSKKVQFQLSGITAANTRVLTVQDSDGTIAYTGNKLSAFAATTSAELKAVISDETGSGSLVFGTSPSLASPTISDYALLTEASAPSTPASGKVALYAKTDKKLYTKDSAGTESALGAGGSGEINLVETGTSDVNDWSTTGANGPTGATTTTAGDLPLSPMVDTALKLTSATSAGAEASHYLGRTLTQAEGLKSRKLKVEFWMRPGTNFIASEWTVSVYSGSTRMALSTDSSGVTYLPNATGKFTTYFDADTSSTYTLRFSRPVNAGGNAAVLNVAGIVVGPGIQPQGAVNTEWVSYTPTGGMTTNTTYTGKWRRVGDTMHGRIKVAFAGAPNATQLRPVIPTGYTIDTSKLASTTAIVGQVGTGIAKLAGSNYVQFAVVYNDTTSFKCYYWDDSTGVQLIAEISATVPLTIASGDEIDLEFSVPIAEWAGSGTVNLGQNDVEYASNSSTSNSNDTSSFAYGPAGSSVPTITAAAAAGRVEKTVRFQTPIQASDALVLEILNSGQSSWVPVSSSIDYCQTTTQQSGGTTITYGIGIAQSSSTDVIVWFGKGGAITSGNGYGTAGTNFPRSAGDLWRVRKVKAGQAVGFGLADYSGGASVNGLVRNRTTAANLTSADLTSQGNCTIDSGDVITLKWKLVDNQVTLWFLFNTVTITGGATSFGFTLPSTLPAPAATTYGHYILYDNSGTNSGVYAVSIDTSRGVVFRKGGAAITGGTNTNYVYGQFSYSVD